MLDEQFESQGSATEDELPDAEGNIGLSTMLCERETSDDPAMRCSLSPPACIARRGSTKSDTRVTSQSVAPCVRVPSRRMFTRAFLPPGSLHDRDDLRPAYKISVRDFPVNHTPLGADCTYSACPNTYARRSV